MSLSTRTPSQYLVDLIRENSRSPRQQLAYLLERYLPWADWSSARFYLPPKHVEIARAFRIVVEERENSIPDFLNENAVHLQSSDPIINILSIYFSVYRDELQYLSGEFQSKLKLNLQWIDDYKDDLLIPVTRALQLNAEIPAQSSAFLDKTFLDAGVLFCIIYPQTRFLVKKDNEDKKLDHLHAKLELLMKCGAYYLKPVAHIIATIFEDLSQSQRTTLFESIINTYLKHPYESNSSHESILKIIPFLTWEQVLGLNRILLGFLEGGDIADDYRLNTLGLYQDIVERAEPEQVDLLFSRFERFLSTPLEIMKRPNSTLTANMVFILSILSANSSLAMEREVDGLIDCLFELIEPKTDTTESSIEKTKTREMLSILYAKASLTNKNRILLHFLQLLKEREATEELCNYLERVYPESDLRGRCSIMYGLLFLMKEGSDDILMYAINCIVNTYMKFPFQTKRTEYEDEAVLQVQDLLVNTVIPLYRGKSFHSRIFDNTFPLLERIYDEFRPGNEVEEKQEEKQEEKKEEKKVASKAEIMDCIVGVFRININYCSNQIPCRLPVDIIRSLFLKMSRVQKNSIADSISSYCNSDIQSIVSDIDNNLIDLIALIATDDDVDPEKKAVIIKNIEFQANRHGSLVNASVTYCASQFPNSVLALAKIYIIKNDKKMTVPISQIITNLDSFFRFRNTIPLEDFYLPATVEQKRQIRAELMKYALRSDEYNSSSSPNKFTKALIKIADRMNLAELIQFFKELIQAKSHSEKESLRQRFMILERLYAHIHKANSQELFDQPSQNTSFRDLGAIVGDYLQPRMR